MNEEVLISSNGDILVTNKVNNEQFKGKLSASDLGGLRTAAKKADFYSLENTYYWLCEDCPNEFITVTDGSRSKTVIIKADYKTGEDIQKMPASLEQFLDKLMDYYARKIEW